jgi:type II secretory pathway component PulC
VCYRSEAMIALLLAAVLADAGPPADLVVVGTIVSPRPDRSMAILRSAGRTRTVAAGDAAFGGRVAFVSQGVVALDFGPERIELRLAGGGPATPPPIVAAQSRPADGSLTMARSDVERRLGEEIPKILAETTVVPYLDQGAVTGLLLSRLPPGILNDVGLRQGDVLQSLNDVPVDSLATLASLWPRFQNATEVRAVVLRDGRPLNLTVSLH